MANQLAANTGIDLGLPEHADKSAGTKMGCSLVGSALIGNVVIGMTKWYEPEPQFIADIDPATGV